MTILKTLVLSAVAVAGLIAATPAQAYYHHYGHRYYRHGGYGPHVVYYGGGPYYADTYCNDGYYGGSYYGRPYYGGSYYGGSYYGPGVTFAFGGHGGYGYGGRGGWGGGYRHYGRYQCR